MKTILVPLALFIPAVVMAQPSPQIVMPMNPPMNPSKAKEIEKAASSYVSEVTYGAISDATSTVQTTANAFSNPNEKLTYGVVSTIGKGMASGAAVNTASNIASGPPTSSDVANAASTAVYSTATTAADNVANCATATSEQETIAAVASGSAESANSKLDNAANTSKFLSIACLKAAQ